MNPNRWAARLAAVTIALVVLVGVCADLLASDAPVVARYRGAWLLLPAVTEPSLWAAVDRAELDQSGYAIWPPVRARPVAALRQDAGFEHRYCADAGGGGGAETTGHLARY